MEYAMSKKVIVSWKVLKKSILKYLQAFEWLLYAYNFPYSW